MAQTDEATPANALAIETKLKKEAADITGRATALVVKDQESYDGAAVLLKAVIVLKRDINAYHKPWIDDAKESLRKMKERLALMIDPLEAAEDVLRKKTGDYDAEKERERIRLEREAAEKARKEEEERRLVEAEALEKAGMKEEAEQVLDTPIAVPKPVIQNHQRAAGMTTVTTWKFTVENPNIVPREYLMVDEVKIGKLVRAQEGAIAIPGVRVWADKSTRVRV